MQLFSVILGGMLFLAGSSRVFSGEVCALGSEELSFAGLLSNVNYGIFTTKLSPEQRHAIMTATEVSLSADSADAAVEEFVMGISAQLTQRVVEIVRNTMDTCMQEGGELSEEQRTACKEQVEQATEEAFSFSERE